MNDAAELKVVPIGIRNLKAVPQNLRRLADDLESGEFMGFGTAIVILCGDAGGVYIYGYGEHANPLECAGWLARASTKVNSIEDPARAASKDPI